MPYDSGGFYGQVGGNLPWGSGGSSFTFNGSPQALAQSYGQSYNDALNMNKSNYNNIMQGYQSLLGSQQAAQGRISGGYDALKNSVMGLLDTQGQSQNQSIMDQYAAALGKSSQQLINRGLGNTTIQSSVARGNLLDRTKALNQNNEAISGLKANALSRLGLEGLGAEREFYQANTGLGTRQLGFMADLNAKYPDASLYAQLAQHNANRGPMSMTGSGGMGGGGGGVPGLGYGPRASPGYYDGGSSLVGGGGGGGMGAWAGSPISGGYGSPYGGSGGWEGWAGGLSDEVGDFGGGGGDY